MPCHASCPRHPLCKSLMLALHWTISCLEEHAGEMLGLVQMSEIQETLMCNFGFCVS